MPPLTFSDIQHIGATDLQRVTVKGGKGTAEGDFFTPPARD
jgi:branched-chain amino acid transport system substrate-binding protein